MTEHLAIAFGLALFDAADHGEQFVQRFARQQRVQERNDIADAVDVGMEITARESEQDRDLLVVDDHRVGAHAAGVAGQRHHHRIRGARRAVRAADQIRAAFAIERRLQHRYADHAARLQRVRDRPRAGIQIQPAVDVGEVAEDVTPDFGRIVVEGMVAQLAGAGGVAGRHDLQRQELHVRRDAVDLEESPRQRVVEGLVQLAIRQRGDAQGVGRADVAPQRTRAHALFQQRFQPRQGFAHAGFVQIDARGGVGLRLPPVAAFETFARATGDVGEARVVVVEAVGDARGRAQRGVG